MIARDRIGARVRSGHRGGASCGAGGGATNAAAAVGAGMAPLPRSMLLPGAAPLSMLISAPFGHLREHVAPAGGGAYGADAGMGGAPCGRRAPGGKVGRRGRWRGGAPR